MLGAKGYIGVEPHNWFKLLRRLPTLKVPEKNFSTKYNFAVEDAVTFLKRLPPSSVCILSSGLADGITSTDKGYEKELEREMERVLLDGGICMVSNSIAPHELFDNEHILSEPKNGHFIDANGNPRHWDCISFLKK